MAATVTLGSTDITRLCQRFTWTEKLQRPCTGEILAPSRLLPAFTEGVTELVVTDSSTEVFVGPAYFGTDSGDANDQMSTIRGNSPDEFFDRRQAQDADGDYSDPSLFEDFEDAVSIFAAALQNTIDNDGAFGMALGSAGSGGVPLVGMRPVDWPLDLATLRKLLCDTGQLDTVVIPGSGGTSSMDLYNGDYGSDLSASVSLDYATGGFNCSAAELTWDLASLITRIRYFLGPKRPQYEGDVQHWAGDVQIDDPALDVTPFDTLQATIESLSASGEAAWGLLRQIVIYDAQGDEDSLKDLFMHTWQADMLGKLRPRKLLRMTPEPGTVPAAGIGDIVSVNALIRGTSVTGTQRIFERTVEQDTEGNQTVSFVVSADQDS